MRAKIDNNIITLYFDVSFESSDIDNDTIAQLCQALKGQIEPVTATTFQQCTFPSGTRYTTGGKATLLLQSEPSSDTDNNNVVVGGAMGLTNSIMLIGFSYLLHFLFKNL